MTQQYTAEDRIRGAEGLLDLEFYEDAAAQYRVLAQECPDDYRVWLGIARIQSMNFTQHSAEVQQSLDRAVDCAKTVDAYNDLQETAGWYAQLKPFAYARQVTRQLPDTEQLAKIKPLRVPLSTEQGVKEARDVSRLKYLKFLLVFVIVLGLPVGFIVSCSEGKNPIINAIKGEEVQDVPAPSQKPSGSNQQEETTAPSESEPATEKAECPYPAPRDNISKGMDGDKVRWVQWCLNDAGFSVNETGVYDDATESAVRSFQEQYAIRIDGIVGPETRAQFLALLEA
ncbi:MAG: peptidoglycan-binding protein [Ruminococcus sp.]|nr:peptidoglycan-binding protein [Ruminococcus sp.]